jgi:pimeloyl-ACP methyl ester carboxylesterase
MIPPTPTSALTRTQVRFQTADGVELSMTRIRRPLSESRGAVVLQHGLGSNGLVFDYPGRSLAQALADASFDCFIPALRGARGQRPSEPYGLDHYVEQDVPAILAAARATSGHARVSWVGHSLGGILMMLHAIEHRDAPIDRFVAIGSALDYRAGRSIYGQLRLLKGLLPSKLRWLPFDTLSRWNARLAGHGPKLLAEKMNFWRDNVEPWIMRDIMSRGFSAIPVRLLLELDTTFGPDGFSRRAGQLTYLPRASAFGLPSCLIVGSRDEQCDEAAVDETARLLSSAAKVHVARFGKAYGHAEDYGHFDLLVGKHAEREVWPTIRDFLVDMNEPTAQRSLHGAYS